MKIFELNEHQIAGNGLYMGVNFRNGLMELRHRCLFCMEYVCDPIFHLLIVCSRLWQICFNVVSIIFSNQ